MQSLFTHNPFETIIPNIRSLIKKNKNIVWNKIFTSQSVIARLELDDYKRLPENAVEAIAKEFNIAIAHLHRYSTELDFMPKHLADFCKDPDNLNWIKKHISRKNMQI